MMMSNMLKIGGKVLAVFIAGMVLGYTEYRIHGGEPIRKLYHEVQDERKAKEAAAKNAKEGIDLIKKGLEANG
jgi:hypothetical protein